jgi:hypothetical protein
MPSLDPEDDPIAGHDQLTDHAIASCHNRWRRQIIHLPENFVNYDTTQP